MDSISFLGKIGQHPLASGARLCACIHTAHKMSTIELKMATQRATKNTETILDVKIMLLTPL